jgi:hypothetical protein
MDREDFILKSLKNWEIFRFKEIVLVDWSSKINLGTFLKEKLSESFFNKLTIVRVDGEKKYDMAVSRNLAARLCTAPFLLSTDSDITFAPDIFRKIDFGFLNSGGFYRGYSNKVYPGTPGTFLAKSEDFWGVGGFNEKIKTYCDCDVNLYFRLVKNGKKKRIFPDGVLFHEPHSDELRVENRPIKTIWEGRRTMNKDEGWGSNSKHQHVRLSSRLDKDRQETKFNEKVFGIGLSRTGQTSLVEAMRLLGYSVVRYPHGIKRIKRSDFSADITVTELFIKGELQRRFPNAKYIYTYRDPREWIERAEIFFKAFPPEQRRSQKLKAISKRAHETCYGSFQFNKDKYFKAFLAHHTFVMDSFKNDMDKLLIMDIKKGDSWGKLCPFLNMEPISGPFIWVNDFEERRVNKGKGKY